jgi:anti-sigma factor RsiW
MLGSKEMASCVQVMRVLQPYLDGHTDEVTARRVAKHLDACRRCGMEASIYREMKAALARRTTGLDADSLERLRQFSTSLIRQDEGGEPPAEEAPPSA